MNPLLMVVLSGLAAGQGMDAAKPVAAVIDAYPSASPDGKRVLFHSNRDGSNQVYVVAADGSGLKRLTDHPGGSLTPKWSPDGATIVYARGSNETSDLWLMDADGSHQRPLVVTPGDDSHPQWTPDGQAIVFNTSRPATADDGEATTWEDIHIVQRDGSGMKRLTDCKATCTYPSLSPDGKRMVYRRVERTPGYDWSLKDIPRNSEVFVADIDGGNAKNLSSDPAFDGWPAWSPDGQWIAFASNRARAMQAGQVYLIHPDGSGLTQLTSATWSHAQPAWSRDSRSLYAYRFQESADSEYGMVAKVPVPIAD
jgi:TolB protein